MIKIKKQGRWLFNDDEIQNDLIILQEKYKKLGYEFTTQECYDIWYAYSDMLSANWLNIDGDISKSIESIYKNEYYWEK